MTLNRTFSLCLVALLASGVLLGCLGTVNAEAAIPKPSVPEFTLKLVHSSFDQPAVYGIDPYTGENVIITPAKHQESTEIVITIKNQPFIPYEDSDGNWIDLSYSVRSKGHFSDDWSIGGLARDPYNSSYTVASENADYYPANAKVDFQVKAWIGYSKDSGVASYLNMPPIFTGETSDWSDTQTITVTDTSLITPDLSSSASSTPLNTSPSSTSASENATTTGMPPISSNSAFFVLDFGEIVIIVLLVVVAVLLGLVVVYLHRKKLST